MGTIKWRQWNEDHGMKTMGWRQLNEDNVIKTNMLGSVILISNLLRRMFELMQVIKWPQSLTPRTKSSHLRLMFRQSKYFITFCPSRRVHFKAPYKCKCPTLICHWQIHPPYVPRSRLRLARAPYLHACDHLLCQLWGQLAHLKSTAFFFGVWRMIDEDSFHIVGDGILRTMRGVRAFRKSSSNLKVSWSTPEQIRSLLALSHYKRLI